MHIACVCMCESERDRQRQRDRELMNWRELEVEGGREEVVQIHGSYMKFSLKKGGVKKKDIINSTGNVLYWSSTCLGCKRA